MRDLEPNCALPRAEDEQILLVGPLFRHVQRLYISRFWHWFGITAPTSVLAALIFLLADQRIQAITRTIQRFTELRHPTEVIEIAVIRLASYWIVWFLGCFALAAIATSVCQLDDDDDDEGSPLRDSHQKAREYIGELFSLAFVTLAAFGAATAAAGIVCFAIAKVVGWGHLAHHIVGLELIATVIVASIVSWLGMAIPIVLRGEVAVWAALKKSLEAADGHQGFLLLLVIQSMVGSYVAWLAVHYILQRLPGPLKFSPWYSWVVVFAFALASAAVQPPMFIGFSVLADETCRLTAQSQRA